MPIKRTYKTRTTDQQDWDKDPDIRGVILAKGSIEVDEEDRAFMNVDTGERVVQVFHSHALNEAFDAGEPGDHIHIEYRGKVKTKKSGRTFNRFAVQVWTEEGEDDEVDTEEETPF